MTMEYPLPSIADFKAKAKRLRADAADQGQNLTHSQALERIAQIQGYRDWNSLRAAAGKIRWQVGNRVAGVYLGQPILGTLRSVRVLGADQARVTVQFDEAVDVVTSRRFSAFRQRVSVIVDATGATAERTGDGRPHLWISPVI